MIVKSLRFNREPTSVTLVGRPAQNEAFEATIPQVASKVPADSKIALDSAANQPGSQHLQDTSAGQLIAMQQQQLQQQLKLENLLNSIAEEIDLLNQNRNQTLNEFQLAAIELATAIASKVCQTRIESGDFPFEQVIANLLEQIGANKPVTVYLHPADLPLLNESFTIQRETLGVSFAADSALGRGECRADSGDAGLISTVDLQTAEIRQLLLEGLHDAQNERRKPVEEDSGIRRYPDRRPPG